jgi:hypothetical protein
MIFPTCKKNLHYILVKYILENMLILTVFLVMGFAHTWETCMESVWVRGNRNGNSGQDYCSIPISGTVAFTVWTVHTSSPVLFACGRWITMLDWSNNILPYQIFVVVLLSWLCTELCWYNNIISVISVMFLQWTLWSWLIARSVVIQLFTLRMRYINVHHQLSTTFWSPAFFWGKSLLLFNLKFLYRFLEYWNPLPPPLLPPAGRYVS